VEETRIKPIMQLQKLTERTNVRPVKAVHRDERVLSLRNLMNFTISLREFCKQGTDLFTGRNTHTQTFLMLTSWKFNIQVHGTCLD